MSSSQPFSEVLDLIEQAPRAPESGRCAGATPEQLAGLKSRLRFVLPDIYLSWLRICNGMLVGPGGLYGTETAKEFLDVEWVLGQYPGWMNSAWLPIAGDGTGNHYIIDVSRSHIDRDAVFFVDVSDDSDALAFIVASNLTQFLKGLLRRELGDRRWPFNASYMLNIDPDIALVAPSALLPWKV